MNKRIVMCFVIIAILLSSTAVWAYNILTVEASVGQYKIYVDGELNVDDNTPNLYYDVALKKNMPITLEYGGLIYVPSQLLNQNINFNLDKESNSISLDSNEISTGQLILNKNNLIKDISIGKIQIDQSEESIENQKDIKFLNFTNDDLKFSKYANFSIGIDTCSKFYNFYSKWLKYSYMIDNANQLVMFYNKQKDNEYNDFDIQMTYNIKTKIVKEVMFIESEKKDTNAQFKTSRGITTGSTVKEMYDAYGQDCLIEANEYNSNNLIMFMYKFKVDNKIGELKFFASYGQDEIIDDGIIDAIDLKIVN